MGLVGKILSFVHNVRYSAMVSDVKNDTGGGPNTTSEHYSSPGDDSHPLPGDYVLTTAVQGNGRNAAAGYLDPVSEPISEPGEKRTYARSPDGITVAQSWLKNDGTIVVSNDNGSIVISPDGTTTVVSNDNGVFTISPDGASSISNDNGSFSIDVDGTITGLNAFGVNGFLLAATGDFFVTNGVGYILLQASGVFLANNATITATGEVINADGIVLGTHTHTQGPDSPSGDTQQNTGPPL